MFGTPTGRRLAIEKALEAASTGYDRVAFVLSIPTAVRCRWFLGRNVIAGPATDRPVERSSSTPSFDRSFEEAVLGTGNAAHVRFNTHG
jgi:hypothetical protein